MSKATGKTEITLLCDDCHSTWAHITIRESPFADLPPSHCPSDDEFQRIRAALAEMQEDLLDLQDVIEEQLAGIQVLQKRRQLVTRNIQKHRAMIAPIRRLPAEMLEAIFLHCLDSEESRRPMKRTAPLVLAQVCRRWREVALLAPALWSTLRMPFMDNVYKRKIGPTLPQAVEMWLGRSGEMPLDLEFCPSWMESKFHDMLIDVMTPFFPRCRSLRVEGRHSTFEKLRTAMPTFPMLDTLDIEYTAGPLDRRWHMFRTAPRLHTLKLESIPGSFVLPWAQILDATVTVFSRSEYFDVLAQAKMLRSFTCNSPLYIQSAGDRPEVSHPTLESLTLRFNTAQTVVTNARVLTPFLSRVSLPALQHLAFLNILSGWEQTTLASFLARSSCTLRSLTLHKGDIKPEDLCICLQGIPTLEQLSLVHFTRVVSSLFISLIVDESEGVANLLPKLNRLLVDSPNEEQGRDAFVRMVNSRRRQPESHGRGPVVESLRKVELIGFGNMSWLDQHTGVWSKELEIKVVDAFIAGLS